MRRGGFPQLLLLFLLVSGVFGKSSNGSRERATACKVKVRNKNGFFVLQVSYKDPSGAEKKENLAYGISTEFEAASGSTMSLHAALGGTKLRRLPPELCAAGTVHVDCKGPTIWDFDCTQPYN